MSEKITDILTKRSGNERDNMLRVGVITSAHGIKGEVNVFPTTDDINRFKKLKKVYADSKKNLLELNIESVKFFKGTVILGFEEFSDRNYSEQLRSMDLLIDRSDALPLGEDEYYICDIIGFKIITDDGHVLGTLKDVLQTGANDVYVVENVDSDKKEILIPAIRDCIISTDVDEKLITVHLLPGLI